MTNKKSVKDQVSENLKSMNMEMGDEIEDLHENLAIYDIPEIEDPYGDGNLPIVPDGVKIIDEDEDDYEEDEEEIVEDIEEEEEEMDQEYREFLEYKKKKKELENKKVVEETKEIKSLEEVSSFNDTITSKKEEVERKYFDELPEIEEPTLEEEVKEKPKKEVKKQTKPIHIKKEEKTTKPEKHKKKTKKDIKREAVKNIELKADEIEITDGPATGLSKIDDYDIVMNDPSTYQVVCNQSCYVAHMSSIKYGDALAISGSTAGAFEERSKVYRMLYKKMEKTSLGNITYNDFLKITSFFDAETLMFGIYQQSFPGTTNFTVQCKHCGTKHSIDVDNERLIAIKDENVYKGINETIANSANPQQALANSVVNKTVRKILPVSKIVVDIAIPSLKDHLDLLGSVKPEFLETNKELLSIMLFIKRVFIMDVSGSLNSGKGKYYEIVGKEEIAELIKDLSIKDSRELSRMIQEKTDNHAVSYAISSFPCPNADCGKELGDMPIDIENLLFFNILQ